MGLQLCLNLPELLVQSTSSELSSLPIHYSSKRELSCPSEVTWENSTTVLIPPSSTDINIGQVSKIQLVSLVKQLDGLTDVWPLPSLLRIPCHICVLNPGLQARGDAAVLTSAVGLLAQPILALADWGMV